MQQSLHESLPIHVRLPGVNGFARARLGRMRHHDFKVVRMTADDNLGTSKALGRAMHKSIDQEIRLQTIRRTLFSVTSP